MPPDARVMDGDHPEGRWTTAKLIGHLCRVKGATRLACASAIVAATWLREVLRLRHGPQAGGLGCFAVRVIPATTAPTWRRSHPNENEIVRKPATRSGCSRSGAADAMSISWSNVADAAIMAVALATASTSSLVAVKKRIPPLAGWVRATSHCPNRSRVASTVQRSSRGPSDSMILAATVERSTGPSVAGSN